MSELIDEIGIVKEDSSKLVDRFYTDPDGRDPFDEVIWSTRDAVIKNADGEVIFEQRDIEAPSFWSDRAVQIVAEKYFRGAPDLEGDGYFPRETSIRQMIQRIVDWYVEKGKEQSYFIDETEATSFDQELTHILVNQIATFNSPVWFNVGIEEKPFVAACFLNPIEDNMESILGLSVIEGRLFSQGSGTGTNLSPLRGSMERLSRGGVSSGPVSFLKVYDAAAGVIKSGGKTRRAAKMNVLNDDHPDIEEFIMCKAEEERKARVLIAAGYNEGMDGPAYTSVRFQNENLSMWTTDDFMKAVKEDRDWDLHYVKTGKVFETVKARRLWGKICEAAWECADPGLMFSDTINRWHTCPECGPITTSNPCSEVVHNDGTACNLASINLMKFFHEDGTWDRESFQHVVRVLIMAMDISISVAGYPSELNTRMANDHRPLGLGFANLGALLMSQGLPYDSDAGRVLAAKIVALMTGEAYRTSSRIADRLGTFTCFDKNREEMLGVISDHLEKVKELNDASLMELWCEVADRGEKLGFRNSQVTVLAPTGTISFKMDCDTTGIEPDFALVKIKRLAGKDGILKMVNRVVPRSLKSLGYPDEAVAEIAKYIEETGTVEGCARLKEEHLPVFDCAVEGPCPVCRGAGCSTCSQSGRGVRAILPRAHVDMVAAVTPYLSGSCSKTVNLPADTACEEIGEIYTYAWEKGVKSISVYRDGSKGGQPLSVGSSAEAPLSPAKPERLRLADEFATGRRKKFRIDGFKGYIHTGEYPDGSVGEMFLRFAKQGSTLDGLANALAVSVSIGLQHGVPLSAYVDQFLHTDFEPRGVTKDSEIPFATSVLDFVFRWLGNRYLSKGNRPEDRIVVDEFIEARQNGSGGDLPQGWTRTGPPCSKCGSVMVRTGNCHCCMNCGESSGCSS